MLCCVITKNLKMENLENSLQNRTEAACHWQAVTIQIPKAFSLKMMFHKKKWSDPVLDFTWYLTIGLQAQWTASVLGLLYFDRCYLLLLFLLFLTFSVFIWMLQTFVTHLQTYDIQTDYILKFPTHLKCNNRVIGPQKYPLRTPLQLMLNLHKLLHSRSMAHLIDTCLETRI